MKIPYFSSPADHSQVSGLQSLYKAMAVCSSLETFYLQAVVLVKLPQSPHQLTEASESTWVVQFAAVTQTASSKMGSLDTLLLPIS